MKNFAWGESNTSELGNQPFVWYNLSMNVLTSVGILLLLTLILVFLQLVPGVFMLISHYASGKFSRRKAADQRLFFILGVESGLVFFFLAIYAILSAICITPINIDDGILVWAMSGVLIALAIAFALYYYRNGAGTKLFISRKLAKRIEEKTMTARLRSDAFVLGFSATIPELIFTMPLYIIMVAEIMRINGPPALRALVVMLIMFAAILPLLIIAILFDRDCNLAELARKREQNKSFVRCIVSLLYILLAGIIITFRILL